MSEPREPDTITEQELAELGLADTARARRILLGLPGNGVTDEMVGRLLPSLLEALRESPDPDRALVSFDRWTQSVTSRYTHFQYLQGHPAALRIFFSVCGVSQFFSDILIRSPEYFEILANPGVRGGGKSADALYRELSGFVDGIVRPELKLEAMRRFRQREVLRIGTRDILELADMPTTAREFSNLADACVQKCYEIAVRQLMDRYDGAPPPPFAVVAMGKLGGQELNYSSDIDLMFVCADEVEAEATEPAAPAVSASGGRGAPGPTEYAHKLAELIVAGLSREMAGGHLFRVDMRLRPEGRFGALVRTLSSYRAYYESWAEPWERQALLKARPVAGDPQLGEAFRAAVTPFVYRRRVAEDFVAAIRHNKARMERKAEMEGQAATNVKLGLGGIRDVEFTVQLLQLAMGGTRPLVRTPNTLEAIGRLRQAGALTHQEADELADDYRFLRTVEHRLQILYELQTQTLPSSPGERRLLARRLGYADAAAFDADYARRTHRVRRHFEAIFLGSPSKHTEEDVVRDAVSAADTASGRETLAERLREAGFREPARAALRLAQAVTGGDYGLARPESRQGLIQLSARLVACCARTGDPDAALDGVDLLAAAVPNRAELYRSLAEEEDLLDRLCRLGAWSPPQMRSLSRHLEWLDMLVGEEIADPTAKDPAAVLDEMAARGLLGPRAAGRDDNTFWDGLVTYVARERLRIAARELWGEVGTPIAAAELTALAEGVIEVLLQRARTDVAQRAPNAGGALEACAVVGLGKLGGRELGYASDWDLLLVYDDAASEWHRVFEELGEALLAAGQELRIRGVPVQVDARLRPEGRFGALARPVSGYRQHYLEAAETWERQALTKARPVAGSAATGRAYLSVVEEAIYSRPLLDDAADEIRHMKRRIEAERLKVGERYSDLKLGHGGMSDIEFTVQLWQMRVGARCPAVRIQSTVPALGALGSTGAVPVPDAARLAQAYTTLAAARARIALQTDAASDTLPAGDARLEALALALGYVSQPQAGRTAGSTLRERLEGQMRETRAAVERLLYGQR